MTRQLPLALSLAVASVLSFTSDGQAQRRVVGPRSYYAYRAPAYSYYRPYYAYRPYYYSPDYRHHRGYYPYYGFWFAYPITTTQPNYYYPSYPLVTPEPNYYVPPAYLPVAPTNVPARSSTYVPESSASSSVQAPGAALIQVRVPMPDALVWFDGFKTEQFGVLRSFVTPLLPAESSYTYKVRVRWIEDGLPHDQTRTVQIRAGQQASVAFTRP